ncbi:uncharacterized protein ACIBXB_015712 [Morphnus guianensis]
MIELALRLKHQFTLLLVAQSDRKNKRTRRAETASVAIAHLHSSNGYSTPKASRPTLPQRRCPTPLASQQLAEITPGWAGRFLVARQVFPPGRSRLCVAGAPTTARVPGAALRSGGPGGGPVPVPPPRRRAAPSAPAGPRGTPPPPAAKPAAPPESRHRRPPCPSASLGPRGPDGRTGVDSAWRRLQLRAAAAAGPGRRLDVAQNPAPRAPDPVRRVAPARMQAATSAAAVSFQRPNRPKPARTGAGRIRWPRRSAAPPPPPRAAGLPP